MFLPKYPKTKSIGSIGSIVLGVLEVQAAEEILASGLASAASGAAAIRACVAAGRQLGSQLVGCQTPEILAVRVS